VARRRDLVAFVEVKARATLDTRLCGDAAPAETHHRRRHAWLMAHPEHASFEMRFDAVLVAPRHVPRHLPGRSTPAPDPPYAMIHGAPAPEKMPDLKS